MPQYNGMSAAPGESLPRRASQRPRPGPPSRWPLAVGGLALVAIVFGSLIVVAAGARGPGSLSPPSHSHFFPTWMAGPLIGAWPFATSGSALLHVFDYAVIGMYGFYILAVIYAPRLRRRWILAAILAVHLIFLISPPLPLTDIFNYINYGRMEIVHGLNPYATIPALEPHSDPSYTISNWHHLLSPYGPLFTIFTFALVPLGVAASFWAFKATLMLASLATLFLVWRCAEMLHRDPLTAVILVGLNPPVLVWGLGGDHNDFLMVLCMMLAIFLLLSARRQSFSNGLAIDRDRIAGPRRRAGAGAGGAIAAARNLRGGLAAGVTRRSARGAATLATRASLVRRRLIPARSWVGVPDRPSRLVVAASAPAIPAAPPALGSGFGELSEARSATLGKPRHVATAATRAKALHFCAGLALVAGCAIKLPAAILVPILFAAAPRRSYLLAGMAAALLAVAFASYSAFGARLPDLGVQSNLVTTVGLPNLLGSALGLGGETVGLRLALTGLLVVAVGLCALWAWRSRGEWIVPAAFAVLVLVLTLSWQVPWYLLWLLPLAALTRRPHIRVATLALGVYVILSFTYLINIHPPGSLLQTLHARETKFLVH